jgi:cyclopropane fatty-acyl-phospholipid synthase-like methyltransferase
MDESKIFEDAMGKLQLMDAKTVMDIGCGCSTPALDLVEFCKSTGAVCVLVDHPNVVGILRRHCRGNKNIVLIGGKFPEVRERISRLLALRKPAVVDSFDAIICYNVLHHIVDMNCFKFLDEAVSLLGRGGRLLIGDIPNESKKQRFLSTRWGKNFHRKWSGGKEPPERDFEELPAFFDDSTSLQILQRYRAAGFETYLLPQDERLPFCYTREDILIVRHR